MRSLGVPLIVASAVGLLLVLKRSTPATDKASYADGRALISCQVVIAGRPIGVDCPPLDQSAIDAVKNGLQSIPQKFNEGAQYLIDTVKGITK